MASDGQGSKAASRGGLSVLAGGKGTAPNGPSAAEIIERREFAAKLPEGVDPDEFYIADKKSMAPDPMQARIPIWLKSQLDTLFHSRRFPAYKTPSDLVRHALRRHAAWLVGIVDEMGGEPLVSFMSQIDIINKIALEEMNMAAFTESIDLVDDAVKKISMTSDGGRRQAGKLLSEIAEQINGMPDEYWKSVYSRMFNKRFDEFMRKNLPGASLVRLADYDEAESREQEEQQTEEGEIG
jgi:hypothetical protein